MPSFFVGFNMPDNKKKSLLKFPCQFPIKVMGKTSLEFQGEVMGVFRKHFPSLPESAIKVNYSKENQYISMTVTIDAQNQAQLDRIYQDLSGNKHVLMVL